MSLPTNEAYSRNAYCALNLTSTVFFIIKVQLITSQKRQEESTTVKPNTESSMRQTLLSDQLTHGGERKPPT